MQHLSPVTIGTVFTVKSGDFHAMKELDPGSVPLISCGDYNNGLIGYFSIPTEKTYKNAITVAYNGQPLTSKFHPYLFGAKDDVAVLIPKIAMRRKTLLYFASILNYTQWRYSYGRKCFKEKLRNLSVPVPMLNKAKLLIDEEGIEALTKLEVNDVLPAINKNTVKEIPKFRWDNWNIMKLFSIDRGDFHSIADLDSGKYVTISRVSEDNGVVGMFDLPDGAKVYAKGLLTVSTVGGDAFVQLQDFIATDNVVICTPRRRYKPTTVLFLAFLLNRQRWRYSYGRQCYKTKFAQTTLHVPVNSKGDIDEDEISKIMERTSYWPTIAKHF